jgi:hypothetical protein
MRIVALIDDPAVIRRILAHLGLWRERKGNERDTALPDEPEGLSRNNLRDLCSRSIPAGCVARQLRTAAGMRPPRALPAGRLDSLICASYSWTDPGSNADLAYEPADDLVASCDYAQAGAWPGHEEPTSPEWLTDLPGDPSKGP